MTDSQDNIRISRAYEEPGPSDGYRVLVDRLWPRGVSKEQLKLDAWLKQLAPSTELRRWFGHDPSRWEEFRNRYRMELESPEAESLLADLVNRAKKGRVILIYGAKDAIHNDAVVLQEVLEEKLHQLQQTA